MHRRERRDRPSRSGDRYETSGHHIQFYAAQHEAMPATKAIRQMPGLIVPGWREPHAMIHAEIEYVPPLSMHMAGHVLQHYEDEPDNHLRSIDNLMGAIEEAQRHHRATDLEIAIGDLAIQAVEMQRPFIREMRRGL